MGPTPLNRTYPGVVGASPPTPAARVIALTQHVTQLEVQLEDAKARARKAERDYETRLRSFQTTSFGGVPMAQYGVDLFVWESVLNSNPNVKGIVEIGTWQGGFSGWLWAQAMIRGIGFITFDAVAPSREVRNFHRLDVFADPEVVADAIKVIGEPLVLFCDGGNKPRELRTFSWLLRDQGSVIAVHDWKTETMPEDVPENLHEVYGDFCDDHGSITRFFRPPTG